MRLYCQILLESPPLNLLAGSAPESEFPLLLHQKLLLLHQKLLLLHQKLLLLHQKLLLLHQKLL